MLLEVQNMAEVQKQFRSNFEIRSLIIARIWNKFEVYDTSKNVQGVCCAVILQMKRG